MRALFRNFPRAAQVLGVLWSFFLVPYLIPSRRKNVTWAVQTRRAVEQLGGAWIKLGQGMALRFDLLPASFCYELFKLLNEVPPFPYSQVREIIKRELGDYPEAVYLEFEPEPFASASIGQVHRAVLPNGAKVAVKVQRPGIRKMLRTDIDLMYTLTGILDRTRLFRFTPSREVIDEFARWAIDELDYTVEARHASVLHQNSQGDRLERIPYIYWRYTSPRVLTMEFLDGIPLSNIMHAIWNEDHDYLNALEADGYDLTHIARHIDWNMLNQMYINGYFHADIHPANLLVLPGNVIGYVDFGIVGVLTDDTRESLIQYTWYFYQGRADRAVEQLARWMKPSHRTNMDEALRDLTRVHEEFRSSLDDPADKPARDTASTFAVNVLIIIRRHGLAVSPGVLAYVRTVVTADTLRLELTPNYDFLQQVEFFFSRLISQQAREWMDPRKIITGVFDYGFRARQILGLVESQSSTLEGLSEVFLSTRRGAQTAARRIRMVAVIALVAAGVALFLRASPGLMAGRIFTELTFDWFTIGILVILAILAITIFTQSRKISKEEEGGTQVQAALQRRWEEPERIAKARQA